MNTDVIAALKVFKPRAVDAWVFEDARKMRQIIFQILNFPAIAWPSCDAPVFICGIVKQMGVGEVWLLTGEGFEDVWRKAARVQKNLCETAFKVFNLHRLHMLVDSTREDAKRYARIAGFEYSNTNPGLGPRGEDMDFYIFKNSGGANG